MTSSTSNWPAWVFEDAALITRHFDWTQVTPEQSQVLRFTEQDFLKLQVVILGQDPYPQRGVANGWAFASAEASYIPPSLQTLFAEIKRVQGFVKADSSLTSWVDQGVLLLNTALTTVIGQKRAHHQLWTSYTAHLISWLDSVRPNLVWVLWGQDAQSYQALIKHGTKLIDAHPSPLSAYRRKGEPFISIKSVEW